MSTSNFWQNPKNILGLVVLIVVGFILLKFIKPILTLVVIVLLGLFLLQFLKKQS